MDASINSSELQSDLAGGRSPLVIDVRKPPAFRAASDMIAGALRRDPARVSAWAKELPPASTVVTYCVRGHDVSQGVAQTLREAGISARSVFRRGPTGIAPVVLDRGSARMNAIAATNPAPSPVTLTEAFWYWLKPGFISFGGPRRQIAYIGWMMHKTRGGIIAAAVVGVIL